MSARVGSEAQPVRLVQRLRDLTPPWAISEKKARRITERQARLLLADAGITVPPVPTEIVSRLDGIEVYPLPEVPVKGLLGASRPSAKGGDILIDATLPTAEQRVTLLHELKHIIDGGHATRLRQRGRSSTGEHLCTEFAFQVLMPQPWLRADWSSGVRDPAVLAARYQVPIEAVQQRLHNLGLVERRPAHRRRAMCQWHPESKSETDKGDRS
jgi:hypothetical protein